MVKALFVIWSLETGGAERFLVSLIKYLDKTKFKPTVCCLNWEGIWAKELEDIDVEVIALNKRGKFDIASFIRLFKIIKKGKFDIVNTHLWAADVLGRLAAILAGTPVIITTAQNVDVWKNFLHRFTDRLLSYRTTKLIAVSQEVKKYYNQAVGIPLNKIVVIPNAIEMEKFKNVSDISYLYDEFLLKKEDIVFVCIGRLTGQKGQKFLLEAVSFIKDKYPQLRLILAGDGEDKEELYNISGRLNLDGQVIFGGYRKDIPQILNLADALILPSLYEGLPVCVLEAMAAGKPVIATKAGGTPELINDGETGFLVPTENPQALSSAIEKLVNLPDKGRMMGAKGREVVMNRFSIENIAAQTGGLFEGEVRKKYV